MHACVCVMCLQYTIILFHDNLQFDTCSIDVLILAADKLYIFTSFIILVDFSSSF